jgi:hypothetical protein
MNGETLYIDLIAVPPDWREWLRAQERNGMRWERWEGQPIADQIKLHGCTNVPDDLPPWVRRP